MPWLFLVTSVIFLIFIPTGLYANHILSFFIGVVGLGISSLLFSLTANRKWKGYRDFKSISWLFRIVALGVCYICFYLATFYYPDVSAFREKEYQIAEGIPTKIIPETTSKGIDMVTVILAEESFHLIPKAEYYLELEKLEGRQFKIYYCLKPNGLSAMKFFNAIG